MSIHAEDGDINRVYRFNKSETRDKVRSSLHLQRRSQETCLLAGAEEDSCVWCGIFKRINAAPIPAPCLTYF